MISSETTDKLITQFLQRASWEVQTFNQSSVQPLSLKLSLNKHTDTEMTSEDHCALPYGLPGPDFSTLTAVDSKNLGVSWTAVRQVKTTKSISSTDHLNITNNPFSWQIRSFQYQDFSIKYVFVQGNIHGSLFYFEYFEHVSLFCNKKTSVSVVKTCKR